MCPGNKDMILQASNDWDVPSVWRQGDMEEGNGRERRSKRGQATTGALQNTALPCLSVIWVLRQGTPYRWGHRGQNYQFGPCFCCKKQVSIWITPPPGHHGRDFPEKLTETPLLKTKKESPGTMIFAQKTAFLGQF